MTAPSVENIRWYLQHLSPGATAFFNPAGTQPHNRVFYLRVNGVAYRLWGASRYTMHARNGEVWVHRLGVAA